MQNMKNKNKGNTYNKGRFKKTAKSLQTGEQPHNQLKDFPKAVSGKTRESRDVLERKSKEQRLLLDNIKTPKRNKKGQVEFVICTGEDITEQRQTEAHSRYQLGLALTLGMVKALEGCIAVEKSPGQGMVFQLFLPVKAQSVSMEENQVPVTGSEGATGQPENTPACTEIKMPESASHRLGDMP